MSQNILTNALATYKAQCETDGKPVVLDKFIFAHVPGQDPDAPINPNETLPPNEQIQGTFDITQKGFINPDAIVYSIILGTDIGTWPFNWIGLVNSETNLVGAIIHTVDQTKEAADPLLGVEGDTLTRNIITTYTNAAELTQIVVDADVWQLDFNNRLMAMDDRVRQNNLGRYGGAAFIDDGWKVVNVAGETAATVTPGVGYVGGLNCTNAITQVLDLSGEILPKTIYLISSFQGTVNSEWLTQSELRIADTLESTWTKNGITYYSAPLANLASTSDAEDLRSPEWREDHVDPNKNPHPQYASDEEVTEEIEGINSQLIQILTIMRKVEGKLGRVRLYMADDIDDDYLSIRGQTINKSDYPEYFKYLGITDNTLTLPDWGENPYIRQYNAVTEPGATLTQQILKHAHTAETSDGGAHTPIINQVDLGSKSGSTVLNKRFNTNTAGDHNHPITANSDGNTTPGDISSSRGTGTVSHPYTGGGGSHYHYVDVNFGTVTMSIFIGAFTPSCQPVPAHGHTTTINETGEDKLRPDSTVAVYAVKVKYLVPVSL